jgi:peptidoglycan hydrolase-like protein with peptidoglycan-binding domain
MARRKKKSAMTAAAVLTRLPMQGAGYAAAYAGRGAMWVVAKYMRNPLTHTAIAALVVTGAFAASNALFMQTHEHPAPWFVPVIERADGGPEPVIPVTRPKGLAAGKPAALVTTPKVAAPETTASVAAQDLKTLAPIGNTEVFELQKKLTELKLFTGTIDGYYGPQTASAIRRFEELQGLKPLGELNRNIIQTILAAPTTPLQPKPEALAPAATPAPAAVTLAPTAAPKVATPAASAVARQVTVAPAASAEPAVLAPQKLAEIAAPAPLVASGATAASNVTTGSVQTMAPTRNTFLGRPLPTDANEAVEMATTTANEALDTIVGGVGQLAELTQPTAPPAALPSATAKLATTPTPGVPLRIEAEPTKPGEAIAELTGATTPEQLQAVSVNDPVMVARVQRGLASLGFLHGPADGVAGEATAKAIRNFEVYYNYPVTGRISRELPDLLIANGAAI